jgi:hypothetical protein
MTNKKKVNWILCIFPFRTEFKCTWDFPKTFSLTDTLGGETNDNEDGIWNTQTAFLQDQQMGTAKEFRRSTINSLQLQLLPAPMTTLGVVSLSREK